MSFFYGAVSPSLELDSCAWPSLRDVVRCFDSNAATRNDELCDDRDSAHFAIRQRLLQLLEVYGGEWRAVVDVGCGVGATIESLRYAGYIVTGLDPSTQSCEYARRRNPDVFIRSVSLEAYARDTPPDRAEILVAIQTLQCVPD